jgi:hypothetical protein
VAPAQFKGKQFPLGLGRAKFQAKVIEKSPFMHSNDDLALCRASDFSKETSKLNYVHIVHVLNWVIEHENAVSRLFNKVKG